MRTFGLALVIAQLLNIAFGPEVRVAESGLHTISLFDGEVTIAQAIGGARGVRCLVTDVSYLDPFEGIRFRDNATGEVKETACDTLLYSVGLIPERDLLMDAGIEPGTGYYVAGNADYVHDLVDWVSKDGEKLGRALRSA